MAYSADTVVSITPHAVRAERERPDRTTYKRRSEAWGHFFCNGRRVPPITGAHDEEVCVNWLDLNIEERRDACARWIAADGRPEKFDGLEDSARMDPDEAARRVNAVLVDPGHDSFPSQVRARIRPAGPWFVRGELPDATAPRLAVVGTRAVSHEGSRLCTTIVRELAAAGVVVISGGAIGVDTLAHRATLAVGGTTVAFLPSAFDRLTPPRNVGLFSQIVREGGALVSEYPSGVTAHKFHFHRRNGLIAAYANAVLIVRAKAEGGTMSTAAAAQKMGTPLLVIPGSPEDATAAGCNQLIRRGARCVTSAAEVLAELGISASAAAVRRSASEFSASAKAKVIHQLLSERPHSTDELCVASALRPHEVMIALTELELLGRAEHWNGVWRQR